MILAIDPVPVVFDLSPFLQGVVTQWSSMVRHVDGALGILCGVVGLVLFIWGWFLSAVWFYRKENEKKLARAAVVAEVKREKARAKFQERESWRVRRATGADPESQQEADWRERAEVRSINNKNLRFLRSCQQSYRDNGRRARQA